MKSGLFLRGSRNSRFGRSGLSPLEVVVVLSIVALTLGLTLVGIGKAREAARQLACTSQVRQVALAVRVYETRERVIPSLMLDSTEASIWFSLASELGINIKLADYEPVYASRSLPSFIPEPLLCPSDIGTGANYRFNVGSSLSWQPRLRKIVPGAGNGVVVFDESPLALSAISDGLSHTALVSERLAGIGFDAHRRSLAVAPYLRDLITPVNEDFALAYLKDNYALLDKTHDGGQRWTMGMWRSIGYNHAAGPQSKFAGTFNRGTAWWANYGCVPPTSAHPSGVALATCDGAVRFIAEGIDLPVWRALGTRAGQD